MPVVACAQWDDGVGEAAVQRKMDDHVVEQPVEVDHVTWVAVVVDPGLELLEDPRHLADRRVRETVGEALGTGRL